jgi:hypothetical protein
MSKLTGSFAHDQRAVVQLACNTSPHCGMKRSHSVSRVLTLTMRDLINWCVIFAQWSIDKLPQSGL